MWGEDEEEDEDDFRVQEWDNEKLNLASVNIGHLYQQKVDDDNNGNGEESKANENKDEDDDAETNGETTHNQVRDEDGDNTDDPGRGGDVEKSREEYEGLLSLRGGGEEEEVDNGEEHSSRVNGAEAENKNNVSTHTLGGSVEGEGKLGEEQNQNQDDWRAKGARKYKLTEEEETRLAQSKRMRLAEGSEEMDWNDPLARKQRYHEMCLGMHRFKGTINVRKYVERGRTGATRGRAVLSRVKQREHRRMRIL